MDVRDLESALGVLGRVGVEAEVELCKIVVGYVVVGDDQLACDRRQRASARRCQLRGDDIPGQVFGSCQVISLDRIG
jgi:hypothetical protein